MFVKEYIKKLQKVTPISGKYRAAKTKHLTAATIERIIKLCRTAFKEAERLEYIGRNPFKDCNLPKVNRLTRDIWTAEDMQKGIDLCENKRLFLAMNISVACSLRVGECLGLTWEDVSADENAIANNEACIYIRKCLIRASKESLEKVEREDKVYQIFPNINPNAKSVLILKGPKNESSKRKIWLPAHLANDLAEWKAEQEETKRLFGDEYKDYHLVIAQDNGRPCESSMIRKALYRLQEAQGLPKVVFHSLRHFNITYKLNNCNNNIKAVQGDSGHATTAVILDTYDHFIDSERKKTAMAFNEKFYGESSDVENIGGDTRNSGRKVFYRKYHQTRHCLKNLRHCSKRRQKQTKIWSISKNAFFISKSILTSQNLLAGI